MKEKVFEIGTEGGSIIIERKPEDKGYGFYSHVSEMDFTNEGLGKNKSSEHFTFEQAFQHTVNKYPWYQFHLSYVHPDYKNYVLKELIDVLNRKSVTAAQLEYSILQIESVLGVKLVYGLLPAHGNMQEITIEFYNGTTTEYQYANHSGEYYHDSVRSDDLKLYKVIENLDWKKIHCRGVLDINGGTVIVRNERQLPIYIFNSEKAFVSTKPILTDVQGWYYE